MLEVANHNVLDMNVFNVGRGIRERLGMVVANTTSTFKIGPRQLGGAGDLQLRAEPIGGTRSFTSEVVHVYPGDVVQWTLEVDLLRSWLTLKDE